MRIVLLLLALSGCGTAPAGYNDENMVWVAYEHPACSDVTISYRVGPQYSSACHIR